MEEKKKKRRLDLLDDRDIASKVYGKLNDIFGLEPEPSESDGIVQSRSFGKPGIDPLEASRLFGRGYDSLVGAPTRSAIAAAYEGENPASAAYDQFSEDPSSAPDFGLVGNAVADPF